MSNGYGSSEIASSPTFVILRTPLVPSGYGQRADLAVGGQPPGELQLQSVPHLQQEVVVPGARIGGDMGVELAAGDALGQGLLEERLLGQELVDQRALGLR